MKVIALVPFKNEAWVLPSYISSIGKIADEIIALDDNSTDNSDELLRIAGAKIITIDSRSETVVNMGLRRQKLLEAGRAAGGTHFIWLDADEIFSSNFAINAKEEISKLKPGQKMSLRWVQTWKSLNDYLDDRTSPFGYLWKDFIFCDDGVSVFGDKFLSESRTPESVLFPEYKLPEETGVVIHWASSDWNAVQHKQAWYRCTELVEGTRNAFRINVTYSDTLDKSSLLVRPLPYSWIAGIILPEKSRDITRLSSIIEYFNKYGVQFFEKLDIWHIPELESVFMKEVGRKPQPDKPSRWFLKLNNAKNRVKQYINKYK